MPDSKTAYPKTLPDRFLGRFLHKRVVGPFDYFLSLKIQAYNIQSIMLQFNRVLSVFLNLADRN